MQANVKRTKPEQADLGIEGQTCVLEVNDDYTGRNGVCLKARFWYTDPNDGELKPGKNGIFVPIDSAEDFILALVQQLSQATGKEYVFTLVE